jgi:dihydrolipoamide dehydrogenase
MNDKSGDIIEVKVPDIGDFKDVEVIEVLVSPGDSVIEEASLITLESDKASMEIPAPRAGIVRTSRSRSAIGSRKARSS